jgi:ribosomal protein L10
MVGQTALMTGDIGNAPALLIKEFSEKHDKPILKAAYVEAACYVGSDQLEALTSIKSKEELIGEIVSFAIPSEKRCGRFAVRRQYPIRFSQSLGIPRCLIFLKII